MASLSAADDELRIGMAGSLLLAGRNEDAVKAYADAIATTPEKADRVGFNLAIARRRYRLSRMQQIQRKALCTCRPFGDGAHPGRPFDALIGVHARGGPVLPESFGADLRVAPGHTADLRARIFEFVRQNPYDIVQLGDSGGAMVFWALCYRLLWDAEIRAADGTASGAELDAISQASAAPASGSGLVELDCALEGAEHIFCGPPGQDAQVGRLLDDPGLALFTRLAEGGLMEDGPAPQEAGIHLDDACIRDFMLVLSGAVVHPERPGMPVRFDVLLADTRLGTVHATAPDTANALDSAGRGFRFSARFAVPEHLVGAVLRLDIHGAEPGRRVRMRYRVETAPGRADAAPDAPAIAVPPDAKVIGKVESTADGFVKGWALCPALPDASVELMLLLDGQPCAYTRTNRSRADVQRAHGGSGFSGFFVEIPANLVVTGKAVLEIRAISGISAIRNHEWTTPDLPGLTEPAALEARHRFTPAPDLTAAARVSVIILNRNGAALLRDMFGSCPEADRGADIEWIVVDHDSGDDSEDACRFFGDGGLNVRFLRRRGNYSFSESNNFGAGHATGDILLFANNDLIFREPFSERLRGYMADDRVGLLGVRLLDHVDDPAGQVLELVQHIGVFFEKALNGADHIRPFEARRGHEADAGATATRAACVTGAFFAMRRKDFQAVGGFDEEYSYGLEDVDLCLKIQARLGKQVICANDISIVHHRGYSRRKDSHSAIRRRKNNEVFNRRWGNWLRQRIKQTCLSDPGLWTGSRPVFAFAVTEVGDTSSAGDYFTALEMGRALQELIPCHVRYLPQEHWYDLSDVDVLVTMVNRFDLSQVQKSSPWLITVNWMRYWFDRWAEDATTPGYDHLLASSGIAARYLEERLGRAVGVVPIGAGRDACTSDLPPSADLACDYAFTGSRFGPPREIEFHLDPARIEGTGRVFGFNWEGTGFAPIQAGPVPYSRIPEVYASTKVVLDDANIATKAWGSCNSRVFDAMAAGCLLLTNGAAGVKELFGDLVPTYDSRESLTAQLNHWLSHDEERDARRQQLQKVVREEHNYGVRARALLGWLDSQKGRRRIAIKCAATAKEKAQWGDYHYAMSLAAALTRAGHVVRVDCREAWYGGVSNSDDVAIVLRGLVAYRPRLHQCNIMWLISHPHDVPVAEMAGFDHVYVASQPHAQMLTRDFGLPASFLPQATDTTRFFFSEDRIGEHGERNLYVANSRGVFRDPVRWSIQHELPLAIYGVGWEPFISDDRYRGQLVPNEVLSGFYASSKLVVCDHWEDMRQLGYVSNRLFDVLASGGRLIIDRVAGLEDLVPSRYLSIFDGEQGFVDLITAPAPVDRALRREAAAWVAKNHSFDARAEEISARMAMLLD